MLAVLRSKSVTIIRYTVVLPEACTSAAERAPTLGTVIALNRNLGALTAWLIGTRRIDLQKIRLYARSYYPIGLKDRSFSTRIISIHTGWDIFYCNAAMY